MTGAAVSSRPTIALDRVVGISIHRLAALAIGLLAGALAFIGAGNPSYWGDEAASVLSASRPLPSLFAELGHIDAVHGAYYLFLHFWIGLAGNSEAAVRFPSAVAVAFAAAGTVVLARQLFGSPFGLLAGVVFMLLPQVTRMGIEARSYAFAMAAAVWLSSYLVTLLSRRESRRLPWALYAIATAASLYLFLYLALLSVVHLIALFVVRVPDETRRRWLLSWLVSLALSVPILVFGVAQHGQILFLARRNAATLKAVFVGQWFGTPWFALLAWNLIAIGILGTVAARRHRTLRGGALLCLVWLILPTGILFAGNLLITPMYSARYLAFCTPAAAILIALGLWTLARTVSGGSIHRGVIATGLVGLIAFTTPAYLAQRGPYAKDGGSDLRQTATTIAAVATAGDAIVFDESTKPSQRPRLALDLYPNAFSGLDDVQLIARGSTLPGIWDAVAPIEARVGALNAHRVVWAVELEGSPSHDTSVLNNLGFTLERTTPVHRTVIYKFVKEQS